MKKLSITLLAACLSAAVSPPALAQTKKTHPQKARWEEASTNRVKTYVLRLKPGQDLRAELEQFTKAKNIKAGFIVTGVGSLRKAALRLEDKSDATGFDGKFEIVSLVGTLSQDGPHLHISISDNTGKTIGGHLVVGCEIYTTVEIIIGDAVGLKMTREQDEQSGYKELKVHKDMRQKNQRTKP